MLAALGIDRGHHLSVEKVDPLPPGPHDVVVRVGASGVCHTDVAVLSGQLPVPLPVILGHEGAGVVEEVGSEVTSVAVGDRVIGSVGAVCGRCWYCAHGMTHLCANGQALTSAPRVARADGTRVPAFTGLGSFAEAMTVHDASVVRVTTDLPDEQLALIGCAITTGLGAVFNTARVAPGSSVAVIGCGGVGQAVVQGARIAGAARIIAIDPGASKREAAIHSGASEHRRPGCCRPGRGGAQAHRRPRRRLHLRGSRDPRHDHPGMGADTQGRDCRAGRHAAVRLDRHPVGIRARLR